MPGVIEAGSTQTPVVYAIADWQSETEAIIECYVSGRLELSEDAVLKRRSDCLLGAIAENTHTTQ
ncbi:MAG: hypothetical protein GY826_32590 [Fuerstiella sp.]|nr:hypothetical protein [Fuerstiella sp.]